MWNPFRKKGSESYDTVDTRPVIDWGLLASVSSPPPLSSRWLLEDPDQVTLPVARYGSPSVLPWLPPSPSPPASIDSIIRLNSVSAAAPVHAPVVTLPQPPPPKARCWSPEQQRRLAFEERVLSQRLKQFKFCAKTGDTYVEGWERPGNSSVAYQLRVPIPEDYPDAMPRLFVTAPCPLKRFKGQGTISGGSGSDRVLSVNDQGHVEICHTRRDDWNPSRSLFGILFRGLIWLGCYEEYLRTGKDISAILQDWHRRC